MYWEDVAISPIKNKDGEIINFLAVKRDISEMKKAQAEIFELTTSLEQKVKDRTHELAKANKLLMSEIKERELAQAALVAKTKELENFFNVTPELLAIFDPAGNFIKANHAWNDILSYSEKELSVLKITDLIHPDDVEEYGKEVEEKFKMKNSTWNVTSRLKNHFGEYKILEWHNYLFDGLMYSAARDITQQKKELDFQQKLLHLSSQLTGIPTAQIQPSIKEALHQIGEFLSADRSYIFELEDENGTMTNTYEWCNSEITAEIDNLKEIPYTFFPNWMKTLKTGENIVIADVAELPKEWKAEKDIQEAQHIKSVLIIPLLSEKQLVGFAGLDYVKNKKEFSDSEVQNLKMWSVMLTGLINNLRIEQLLEQSRQNYITFFNTIDDFLFVLDEEGKIINTNETVNNRLKYSFDELRGNSFFAYTRYCH